MDVIYAYQKITLLLTLVMMISGCVAPQPITNNTLTMNATNRTGSPELYPNPQLTPGDILENNTTVICLVGYTSTVRNVPLSVRKRVFAEYNMTYPQPFGTYEVDHLIPLELGGSNDMKNLWFEPDPSFHLKDRTENWLHDQVCEHGMNISDAQKAIVDDWYAVYLKIVNDTN
jgi:hypothetical protein